MKRLSIGTLGAIALLVAVPVISTIPGVPNLGQMGQALADTVKQAKVQLSLAAEKKVIARNDQGQEKITWQTLQGKAQVNPGDVIRYNINGQNNGDRAAKKLVLNQPIPQGTIYVLNSATGNNGATTTFSIDGGKNFLAKPTIQVKLPNGKTEVRPAPADRYTQVRWTFGEQIQPKATVNASYEVKVR
ncbi:conserved repeat domain protein [Crinalium epipsammum PCC 9333]|uniref:Conserved repeat domain protein n=1 Tax=Crinalium epipsammum PCC 9333 TaxID=1173022 RepID=K9VXX5_9CYAN|nr:DUF11 domain-containing protein [Crinalium epipsammum]AFZ12000.1 conserved repeat domain protein [Crinalium epipsammum PCC 9333]